MSLFEYYTDSIDTTVSLMAERSTAVSLGHFPSSIIDRERRWKEKRRTTRAWNGERDMDKRRGWGWMGLG
jgi:hypothetical protein